ncbi:MAG: metal-dependent phosphohydrolase [Pseudomonadales bacterium]|nr:metal-dependent phosphohydrolase [Pseudomonadales bacterium]
MVFDPLEPLLSAFLGRLAQSQEALFGAGGAAAELEAVRAAAILAIETIHRSDAYYHNSEHTMLVTLVGQQIILGRQLAEGGVSPGDWAHFTVSLLCHDIGYVRGACPGDRGNKMVINAAGETVTVPAGATDAALTPHHVERGKLFVQSRFTAHSLLDVPRVCAAIEKTRFPVPEASDLGDGVSWGDLVQAADLIGQLADPDYMRKLPALYYEFEETGANARMGNDVPGRLRDTYPNFFWTMVSEHIKPGISYLRRTREGRDWLAGLYSHVFSQEHRSLLA